MCTCAKQCACVMTPRAKAWLCELAELVPEEQSRHVAQALVNECYVSVDTLTKDDSSSMSKLPGMGALKSGAQAAFRKTFADLKVTYIQCYAHHHVASFFLKA
jgi:hypothetical protein